MITISSNWESVPHQSQLFVFVRSGIFPSDRVTAAFLDGRADKSSFQERSAVLRADPHAEYAERFSINMSEVVPSIAIYPEPDNVVAIDDPVIDDEVDEIGRSVRKLDGVFIGACTTTEEELVLAALVLEAAMTQGMSPCAAGTRKVTPGSIQISEKLERTGLSEVYRKAGFVIGAPGCSYCLGVAAVSHFYFDIFV